MKPMFYQGGETQLIETQLMVRFTKDFHEPFNLNRSYRKRKLLTHISQIFLVRGATFKSHLGVSHSAPSQHVGRHVHGRAACPPWMMPEITTRPSNLDRLTT